MAEDQETEERTPKLENCVDTPPGEGKDSLNASEDEPSIDWNAYWTERFRLEEREKERLEEREKSAKRRPRFKEVVAVAVAIWWSGLLAFSGPQPSEEESEENREWINKITLENADYVPHTFQGVCQTDEASPRFFVASAKQQQDGSLNTFSPTILSFYSRAEASRFIQSAWITEYNDAWMWPWITNWIPFVHVGRRNTNLAWENEVYTVTEENGFTVNEDGPFGFPRGPLVVPDPLPPPPRLGELETTALLPLILQNELEPFVDFSTVQGEGKNRDRRNLRQHGFLQMP